MDDEHTFTFRGRVRMPRSWKALHIVQCERGTIVWRERRSWWERFTDWLEEWARKHF